MKKQVIVLWGFILVLGFVLAFSVYVNLQQDRALQTLAGRAAESDQQLTICNAQLAADIEAMREAWDALKQVQESQNTATPLEILARALLR